MLKCLVDYLLGIFLILIYCWYNKIMDIDYNEKDWATPCPKYDCKKTACKCGLEYVNIPTSLGDDSEGSNVAPKNGAYCNALVFYEANGHVYIYTKEGIPTLIDVDASDIYVLEQEVRRIQEDVYELREDMDDFIYGFDTVADMVSATNLIAGSYAKTLGYYTKGDYGASTYAIVDDELTADGSTIIALDSGLFAVLNLSENVVKPEQFGAYGDGTNDDTSAVQSAINYGIANSKSIEFNGQYKVMPITRDDSTKVCLIFSKPNTGLQSPSIELRFNRNSRVFTTSEDECTLLRWESRNGKISNAIFEGISAKTTLLEMSRTILTSTNYNGYNMDNVIDSCIFRYGKNAVTMEGHCFYNKFTNCRIYNCTNGVIMQMTYRERQGLEQAPSVNRNDFVNVNMNLITNWGIRIEYGDTNKFVNVDLEGCGNGIYVDNPKSHSGDFPIAPLHDSTANTFVNVMIESITTLEWYNRGISTRIYGTSGNWGAKAQMVIEPDVYIGGTDETTSVEKIARFVVNKDVTQYNNSVHYSINTSRPVGASNYYDIKESNNVLTNMSRQNITFDTTPNDSNVNTLTYDNVHIKIKRMGGICFLTGTIKIKPTNTANIIKLYIDTEWMKPLLHMYEQVNIVQPMFVCPYYNGGTLTTCIAQPRENYILLRNFSGTNWHANDNLITLSIFWLGKGTDL